MNDSSVKKCLYCYKAMDNESEGHYHSRCAKKLFGTTKLPILPYTRDNIEELALHILQSNTSITGVQPKLSLDINRGGKNEPAKLTIVGLWGNFILKPQCSKYHFMPELEDLTMKLAEGAGIATAPHGLIAMQDGELAYITRRMDRGTKGEKYSMLDMCQLTNRLTEHKYRGAYIQLAETIKRYSVASMLDVQRFWEIVIFSWITGNSDMHCKNFSLLDEGDGYQLSPSYDLLALLLADPNDTDELAMPIFTGGKTTGFDRDTFTQAFIQSGVPANTAEKRIAKMTGYKDKWFELIDSSFLPEDLKSSYKNLITTRLSRL